MLGVLYTYWAEIVAGLAIVIASFYFYLIKNYGYWKQRGVAYVEPQVPFGTFTDQVRGRMDVGTMYNGWYTKYKRQGLKYFGSYAFRQPSLVLIDLDLCKQILTKDFNHFVARDFTIITHEYITKHLFALEGHEWRDMRTKLTPTFTSGKMKMMFNLMEKCVNELQDHIEQDILKDGSFEVKNLTARFTTDIIATCAFGLEVNSIKEKENEFFWTGQKIFMAKVSTIFKILYYRNFPVISKIFKVDFFDPSISKLLTRAMRDTIEYRKKNNVTRNDFVDLLLKVKENKSLEDYEENGTKETTQSHDSNEQGADRLTLEEMTAQAFVFFAAGFETAASTTSFCLYELAMNPDVQEKLQQEIDEVLTNHGGKITYQALQELTYMDQVMNETLRLYASLPILTRVCTERYQVPGTDLVIDKGIRVNIPSYAIHHDPEIYPDPYKFDPDRFTEENSKDRHHYAFIPFGEGPRICIGMRFGKLQVKTGLAAILSKFQVSPAPDTPSKLEIDPFIIFTTAKHPYRLNICRRTDK